MQVEVTAKHGELPEDVRAYAEDKAQRLSRYFDRLQAVQVVVSQEGAHRAVEMIATTDHKDRFVAEVTHEDVLAAMDLAIDKLERQLRKHKEKLRNRKHPET